MIDTRARLELAQLARALISGEITTDQFEDRIPSSDDPAVREIFNKGFWPLYDDAAEHYLVESAELDPGQFAFASRCILFLESTLPYAWPCRSRSAIFWRGLLNLLTFGAFGRAAGRKLLATGDVGAWPFTSNQQYNELTGSQPQSGGAS